MMSITAKDASARSATAVGRVVIPASAYELLIENGGSTSAKGDVLAVAQLAGIMAAKKTSDLIPLCHPISLTNIDVNLSLQQENGEHSIHIEATAEVTGATGVEMEAVTAVCMAAATVWDMLKAVAGREMIIEGIKVVRKSGGKSGDWARGDYKTP